MDSRQRRYTTKAYLTFVAVDATGKPRPVPALELVDDADRRRFADGERRRADRLRAAGRTA
jgi:acyl-CoA hydrolase